jgi:hypothetical protein
MIGILAAASGTPKIPSDWDGWVILIVLIVVVVAAVRTWMKS